ncbi:MAG: SAM-dependent chlorinase/fluorinase [Nitrospirae bacterium]|nr:SAM-dependent chlorinase/fluorinase [Nitrospirota bacterium]
MLITLTTDFGYKDPFVGVMKGVILSINPSARIIDITHGITPHDVKEAAFTIAESFRYFPPKTIHVVVVDPEVGSPRRPILISADEYYFIGPDNGVFSLVFNSGFESLEVIHLTSEHYFLPERGVTFHGRDVFSPVAGWLSKGIALSNLGEPITDYVTIKLTELTITSSSIKGEVVFIDHFGNAITNIRRRDIDALFAEKPNGRLEISIKSTPALFRNYYSETQGKELSSLINANGYLELFVFKGSAERQFDIKTKDPVSVNIT